MVFCLFYGRFVAVIKSLACGRVKFEMPVRQSSETSNRCVDIQCTRLIDCPFSARHCSVMIEDK